MLTRITDVKVNLNRTLEDKVLSLLVSTREIERETKEIRKKRTHFVTVQEEGIKKFLVFFRDTKHINK